MPFPRRMSDSAQKAGRSWGIVLVLTVGGMTALAAVSRVEARLLDLGIFHGNWCGSGNRLGLMGRALPPVDFLDAACMRHDLCIVLHGSWNCGCDQIFLQELRYLNYPDPHQATKARAVYDAMSWLPCTGPEMMIKPFWFFGQLLEDLHRGGPPPWDVLQRLLYVVNHPW